MEKSHPFTFHFVLHRIQTLLSPKLIPIYSGYSFFQQNPLLTPALPFIF